MIDIVDNKICATLREDNKKFHIYQLDMELDSLEKLLSFAERKPENNAHMKFIEVYKEIVENHKINIFESFNKLEDISLSLTTFINNNIKLIFENEGFYLEGRAFYFSYYPKSYTFFTHLYKDEYFDKNAYGLITYKYKNNSFILDEIAIGFNNNSPNVLRDCPQDILDKIDTMDSADSFNKILNIFKECENNIKKLFFTSDLSRIINYEDESFKVIFGLNPIQIIQKNHVKKDENIIRLHLKQHVDNITSELFELIRIEHTIIRLKQDNFHDMLKDFIPKKEMLLKENKINQEELDKLMSYINLDYLD